VLKIFGNNLCQAVMFGTGPEVRVEPVQLVRRTSTHGVAQYRLVGIKNRKLLQKLFRFSESVSLLERRSEPSYNLYMRNEFTAIVEQDGPWYVAYCAEVPGANGQGKTPDKPS
jgi:hypothetical protein